MSGFLTHTEAELRDVAAYAVERAVAIGAQASATARNQGSATIEVKAGETQKAERDAKQTLMVTVYREGRQGTASTAAVDRDSIQRVVDEASFIADQVGPDIDDDLPPSDWLAFDGPQPELFESGGDDVESMLRTALEIDRIASGASAPAGATLRVSEATATATEGMWALATSDGFCRSAVASNRVNWCMMLVTDDTGTASDYFETRDRRAGGLASPEEVARRAIERTLSARNARPVESRRGPVLFEPRTASGLVGELAGAMNGMAQYRKSSFLMDPIGRQVAASHISLDEDPFEPFGLGSGGFDSEGIAGSARTIVSDGVGNGLFLSTYSARKLGLRSTGNADGFYNLRLTSSARAGDREAMLAKLGTGLLVTGFQGGSTDPQTGNWTRAVRGLWIEDGLVAHAVRGVTLASTAPAMMSGILAVGDDVTRIGSIRTGSILIDEMQVGGGE
jgi:PmbA protein